MQSLTQKCVNCVKLVWNWATGLIASVLGMYVYLSGGKVSASVIFESIAAIEGEVLEGPWTPSDVSRNWTCLEITRALIVLRGYGARRSMMNRVATLSRLDTILEVLDGRVVTATRRSKHRRVLANASRAEKLFLLEIVLYTLLFCTDPPEPSRNPDEQRAFSACTLVLLLSIRHSFCRLSDLSVNLPNSAEVPRVVRKAKILTEVGLARIDDTIAYETQFFEGLEFCSPHDWQLRLVASVRKMVEFF